MSSIEYWALIKLIWRLRFSSDADIARLTNARIIIIIINAKVSYKVDKFNVKT